MTKREADAAAHTPPTGHEGDGIAELNTPLPRWWLWTFYATIVWAIVYWIFYPAWPTVTGYTRGVLGYTNRAQISADLADLQKVQQLRALPRRRRHRCQRLSEPQRRRLAVGRHACRDQT